MTNGAVLHPMTNGAVAHPMTNGAVLHPMTSGSSSAPDGAVTFNGTATTLVQVAGFSILADPNFLHRGQRAYVGMGLVTKRLSEPALSLDQLPPVDFVVLAHHRGDHFDRRRTARPRPADHHRASCRQEAHRRGLPPPDRPFHLGLPQNVARGDTTVTVTSVPGKDAPARSAPWSLR
jgi:hypothetical protein